MPSITPTSTGATVIAILGALSYPVLHLFVLGASFSPLNPESSWGLAAEHGELELEHWSHFIVAIVAALPLALTSKFSAPRIAAFLLLMSSLSAALPYVVQPAHQFEANDSWLANYAWQLGGLEVALAPLFLAAALRAIAWLRSRAQ